MAEHGSFSLPSPTSNTSYRKPSTSFFSLPRLFTGFTAKGFAETDTVISPTSILDTKPFSTLRNSFWSDINTNSSPRNSSLDKRRIDSVGIGLVGIVDALKDESFDPNSPKPDTPRPLLFGSKLKIQVPSTLQFSESSSPRSPPDFGIKSRNCCLSRSPDKKSGSGSSNSGLLEILGSPRVFNASEMELSEDYTCVISYGPNPKTTHIFDDCIVESCSVKEGIFLGDQRQSSSSFSQGFLSFCYNCKKNLEQGSDIYMYRGEKAFCSGECRYQEILLEEGVGKSETDGYGCS